MEKCDGECMADIKDKNPYLSKYLFSCYTNCDETAKPATDDVLTNYATVG
jgi:hypothetical protein